MTTVFITILNMSITASFVALAVILARFPLRKAPKKFSYVLWGVVLFRLFFPFSIESAFSLIPTVSYSMPQSFVAPPSPAIQAGAQFADTTVYSGINNHLTPVVTEYSTIPIHAVLEIAGYIWLAGFVLLLLYALASYVQLKRKVYFATLVRDNIFETGTIKSPFVLGFFRPKIFFPANIDPEQCDYILKHEQTHIKRRDHIIKPLAYIIFAMHWFNPLMWLSYVLMSKDMEMSCDEAVLRQTTDDIRCKYSSSLLSLSAERVNLLSPTAFAFGENNVKARVKNVLNFTKPEKWVATLCVIAVSVFIVACSTNSVVTIGTDDMSDRRAQAPADGPLNSSRFVPFSSHLDEEWGEWPEEWEEWREEAEEWRAFQTALRDFGWASINSGATLEGNVPEEMWYCCGSSIYMHQRNISAREHNINQLMRDGWGLNFSSRGYVSAEGIDYIELHRIAALSFTCPECDAPDTARYSIAYTEYAWFPIESLANEYIDINMLQIVDTLQ
jgi:beta-lactamase regulating signal transducer with metallopeptidase domain